MASCHNNHEVQDLLHGNATVMFQGGGNWGDVWPKAHNMRMEEIARFSARPGMTIITMPNSLKFYDGGAKQKDEHHVARIAERKHPTTRLVFLFRQRDSYEMAKSMYPGADVRLVPDVAFMIGPLVRAGDEKFKYDIVFIARPGPQSEGGSEAKANISDEMARRAPHLTFYVGDWAGNPTDKELLYKHHIQEINIPALRYAVIVDAGVKYLSTAKVIVTDMLHATVLATLLGIPHVMVDGGDDSKSYGKRVRTRAAAFETSDHCTQSSLLYRDASSLSDGIDGALELLAEVFGGKYGCV